MNITRTGFMRARLLAFMPHTYTRQGQTPLSDSGGTPGVDESETETGAQAYGTPPAPVGGRKCRWMPMPLQGTIGGQRTGQYVSVDSTNGNRVVQAPVMLVPQDEPIVPGDLVMDVWGKDPVTRVPVLLFRGPAKVDNVSSGPSGDAGGLICKRVYLRSAQEVP